MAKENRRTRKRRTREHVIAAQCANYVERFIVECGYTFEATRHDYGYDLAMYSYDQNGYAEEGQVFVQLKATDTLTTIGENVVFNADIRDFNLWIKEPMPVFLVLYDAVDKRAFWLYLQEYFEADADRLPKAGAKSVRLRIPLANEVGIDFVRHARQ